MARQITSSLSIGNGDSFNLEKPLEIRECTDDPLYPLSLEGITEGGHDVCISVCQDDVAALYEYFINR